jgi:hypothetical protein
MRPRHRILFKHLAIRLTLGACSFLMAMLLLRVGWGLLAQARLGWLQRDVARTLPAQRDPPLPAPGSPAATLVEVATRFNPLNFRPLGFPNQTFLPPRLDTPWTPEERAEFEAMLQSNAQVLDRLEALSRSAQETPSAWVTSFDTPLPAETTLGERLRLLHDLYIIAALLAHADDHHALAVQHLHRLLALDRVVTAHQSLAGHMLATNTRARVVAMIERMGPTLRVDSPATGPSERAVSQRALRDLIAALLEERAFNEQLRAGGRYQLAALSDLPTPLDERPPALRAAESEAVNWFLRPLVVDERRRALGALPGWLAICGADNFEVYRQNPYLPMEGRLSRASLGASNAFNNQWNRLAIFHFRALADGRVAATLLAARLVAIEQGSLPPTAEKLVPAYLPRTVTDPFAGDGRSFRYHVDPVEGLTVWSVGSNGVDEGALITRVSRGRTLDQPDLVYGAGWRSGLVGTTASPPPPAGTVPAAAPGTSPGSSIR